MPVHHHDSGCALASAGSCFISVWRKPSTLALLGKVREQEQALVDQNPRGILVLTLLLDGSFDVPSNVRKEAAKTAEHFAKSTRAHAYVIEGSGFKTAAARAVIAGIQMFSKTGHPTKVFGDSDEAARWLAAQAPDAGEATVMAAALADARRALDLRAG